MEIAIIVIFGAVLFGFGLLFLAIKIWQKMRGGGNSKRHFSQSSGASGTTLIAEDNDSEAEDHTDFSSIDYSQPNSDKVTEAKAELSGDIAALNTDISNPAAENKADFADSNSESSWSYNSAASSLGYSDSSSYSSCSSNSGDSSSSCSSSSSSD